MMKRLFFALEIPHRDRLAIDKWRTLVFSGLIRPVATDNLHLSLCFIGEVNDDIEQSLIELTPATNGPAIELTFCELGFFSRPGILYLAPHDVPQPLKSLAKTFRRLARRLSLTTEQREYKPHLTLYRRVLSLPPLAQPPCFIIKFEHLVLYQSILAPAGVRYHKIASWQLS